MSQGSDGLGRILHQSFMRGIVNLLIDLLRNALQRVLVDDIVFEEQGGKSAQRIALGSRHRVRAWVLYNFSSS